MRRWLFFREGYNCTQSVLLAFCDIMDADKEVVLKMSSGLGGGMARMREVCGTVSAMAVLAGFISPACDPTVRADRTRNYALVQEFAGRFREENGSIVCRELLSIKSHAPQSPEPSVRTPEFYKTRPCERFVGQAARIVAEYLAENS
jgi:C_GCAxxG_C_C family probable redox protein